MLRKKKMLSWKQYCNDTTTPNPWNAVYKLVTGNIKKCSTLSTLRKPDETTTKDLAKTTRYMIESFTPEDNEESDNEQKITQGCNQRTDENRGRHTIHNNRNTRSNKGNEQNKSPRGGRYKERHPVSGLQQHTRVNNSYVQRVLEDGLLSQAMEVNDNNPNN